MATGPTDYNRGEMEIGAQENAFDGFMNAVIYGGAAVALIVIYPTLIFGTPLVWMPSLVVTVIIGVILGVALKLKGGWYAGLIASAVLTALISALIAAIV